MVSAAVCNHSNATKTAMKPLTPHEEFRPKNAAHFVAARGRTPATRTLDQFATLPQGGGLWRCDQRRPYDDLSGHSPRAFRPHHQRLKEPAMKTKSLTAAQIDTLAQRLFETPIEPVRRAQLLCITPTQLLGCVTGGVPDSVC